MTRAIWIAGRGSGPHRKMDKAAPGASREPKWELIVGAQVRNLASRTGVFRPDRDVSATLRPAEKPTAINRCD